MASEKQYAIYKRLNRSGTSINQGNWSEWQADARAALKMPDFTPSSNSDSLHELAKEVLEDVQQVISKLNRPSGFSRSGKQIKAEDKFYFGNPGTKAESELTIRITKMLQEVEQAIVSRNKEKAKALATKVKDMIRRSANVREARMQMEELQSIMLGTEFSRPGKPKRFSRIDSMLSDASSYIADGSDEASGILTDLIKEKNRGALSPEQVKYLSKLVQKARAMGVFSRPGKKAKFAIDNDQYLALRRGKNLCQQLIGLSMTIKSVGDQASRMAQFYMKELEASKSAKDSQEVINLILKYSAGMAKDLAASLSHPVS